MRLTDNTILITGGGSGIGRGLAEAFFQLGNTVIIAGRNEEKLREVTEANSGMHYVVLDTSSEDSKEVIEKLIAQYPALNVVINNAGILLFDDIANKVNFEDAHKQFDTNVWGVVRINDALLGHFKSKQYAAIVNVTSGVAFLPRADTAMYSASKFALHAYTVCLRYQLRDSSVEVIEVAPPLVDTEMGRSAGASQRQDDEVSEPTALDWIRQSPQQLHTLSIKAFAKVTLEQLGESKRGIEHTGIINPGSAYFYDAGVGPLFNAGFLRFHGQVHPDFKQ